IWMPVQLERLDDAIPCHFDAEYLGEWLRRDVTSRAIVHDLNDVFEIFDWLTHLSSLRALLRPKVRPMPSDQSLDFRSPNFL
ncbi:MAG: hypothetical protein ABI318_15690, partial [Chthoniobacteraceae bacterium]